MKNISTKQIFGFSLFIGIATGIAFLVLGVSNTIATNILGVILAILFYNFLKDTSFGRRIWADYINTYKAIYVALGLEKDDLTKE